jgi:hypothetical protein
MTINFKEIFMITNKIISITAEQFNDFLIELEDLNKLNSTNEADKPIVRILSQIDNILKHPKTIDNESVIVFSQQSKNTTNAAAINFTETDRWKYIYPYEESK